MSGCIRAWLRRSRGPSKNLRIWNPEILKSWLTQARRRSAKAKMRGGAKT